MIEPFRSIDPPLATIIDNVAERLSPLQLRASTQEPHTDRRPTSIPTFSGISWVQRHDIANNPFFKPPVSTVQNNSSIGRSNARNDPACRIPCMGLKKSVVDLSAQQPSSPISPVGRQPLLVLGKGWPWGNPIASSTGIVYPPPKFSRWFCNLGRRLTDAVRFEKPFLLHAVQRTRD